MCSMYMRFVFSVYMYGFVFDFDVCVFLYYLYTVCYLLVCLSMEIDVCYVFVCVSVDRLESRYFDSWL
jgi:hypothetical protein